MKLPKLGTPRLLPVVIFAGLALLLFKGIGIVTEGGYVLSGTSIAKAAQPASPTPPADGSGPSVDNAAPRTEPTLVDSSPTIADSAPTIGATPADPTAAKPPATGAAPGGTTTAAAASVAGGTTPGAAAGTPPAAPPPPANSLAAFSYLSAAERHTDECRCFGGCWSDAPASGGDQANATPLETPIPAGCAVDAVATKLDADGHPMPLAGPDGSSLTQDTLLQRLAERRAALDKREADLNLRQAIVEAAEKQMSARADALKALEAQITTLSDQKKAMEDDQFAGVVKMYEAMKPQDAASIFDGLDMNVLLRVARAMDPRKMSPVLAKMSAARAQDLTAQLAASDPQTAAGIAPVAAADPNSLPQIVGQ